MPWIKRSTLKRKADGEVPLMLTDPETGSEYEHPGILEKGKSPESLLLEKEDMAKILPELKSGKISDEIKQNLKTLYDEEALNNALKTVGSDIAKYYADAMMNRDLRGRDQYAQAISQVEEAAEREKEVNPFDAFINKELPTIINMLELSLGIPAEGEEEEETEQLP